MSEDEHHEPRAWWRALHQDLAEECERLAARLRCVRFGGLRRITTGEIERYLRSGGPMCCGHTMRLDTNDGGMGEARRPDIET